MESGNGPAYLVAGVERSILVIIPRRVSNKILDEVHAACVALSDEHKVCRATTPKLCDHTGRGRATVEAALRLLELAGRIDRQTWLAAHNVKRRYIRAFPGLYSFGRGRILHECCDRAQYLFLRDAGNHKEKTFKQINIERYNEYYGDGEKVDDPFD